MRNEEVAFLTAPKIYMKNFQKLIYEVATLT